MTEEFYKSQMMRLQNRFGAKAIEGEFTRLAWAEVKEMSEDAFKRAVDIWIGSRSHNNPPLMAEFREARAYAEKSSLYAVTNGAVIAMRKRPPEEMREDLAKTLSLRFGNVNGVSDALAKARKKRRLDGGDGEGA